MNINSSMVADNHFYMISMHVWWFERLENKPMCGGRVYPFSVQRRTLIFLLYSLERGWFTHIEARLVPTKSWIPFNLHPHSTEVTEAYTIQLCMWVLRSKLRLCCMQYNQSYLLSQLSKPPCLYFLIIFVFIDSIWYKSLHTYLILENYQFNGLYFKTSSFMFYL